MTLLRQLARLAAVTVGAAAYILADSMDPDAVMSQMSRHLEATWHALEAGHPCVGGPVERLEWAFEMHADPEDDE